MATRVVVSFDGAIVMEVELDRAITVVGRHPDCDIVIDHPAVSLRHALFRVVDRTVYLEDLASTNGTLVNGIVTSSHVLHHLDLIQVGVHKMHFFDDSLLAGGVDDLEHTVFNDYERTMLAPGAAAASPARAPASVLTPAPAPVPAPARGAGRPDEALNRTQAIARPAGHGGGGSGSAAARSRLALRTLDRAGAGEVIALDRASTMVGKVGGDAALVVSREQGFFLVPLSGQARMRLNGQPVGRGTREIREGDRFEVGGVRYEVIPTEPVSPRDGQT